MEVCLLIGCFRKSCPKFTMSWQNCFHAACVFLVLTFTRNTDKHMLRNSAENMSSCNKASFVALVSADRREVLCNWGIIMWHLNFFLWWLRALLSSVIGRHVVCLDMRRKLLPSSLKLLTPTLCLKIRISNKNIYNFLVSITNVNILFTLESVLRVSLTKILAIETCSRKVSGR
jgi:hypothetical protein